MSHVYSARDTVIGRTVAVKILTDQGCQDSETKNRFLAEARMAGNISHDNVISIYDFGTDDEKGLFMVMEFLQGEDLRNAIRHGRTGDATRDTVRPDSRFDPDPTPSVPGKVTARRFTLRTNLERRGDGTRRGDHRR